MNTARHSIDAAINSATPYRGNAQQRINATDTPAPLVFQDQQVRHEAWALTGGTEVRWTYCFVIADGHINHVDDAINDYFEGPKGSADDGVAIKHLLQMSSGSRWNKDYSNPLSDIDNSSKKKIHACFRQNTLRVTYFRVSSDSPARGRGLTKSH
jgi:hypothetical protein